MTKLLLDTLTPIFAGLLLGYVAGRRGLMDNVNVRNLIVFVMNFAVPCALFSTLIQSSRAVLQQHIAASLVITFAYFALYVISYFWARRFLRMHVSESSVLALTIGFPNAAAVALPLLTGAYGSNAAVTAALSLAIGSVTISPLTLALIEADKQSAGTGISMRAVLQSFPQALARPVVWAPAIALFGARRVCGACPLPNGSARRWFRPAGANPAAKLRPRWKLSERRHAWTFLPLISAA